MAAPGGLAEVLARFGPAYCARHALSPAQAKAWRAIAQCRTAALGGELARCSHCGATRAVYHSCRNRHCPRCQTRAKEAWLAARRRELLPVPYFHLVFTLPHALNALAAGQPRMIYEMLFAAASATLGEFAASPRWLGGTAAFTLVLHTWRQDLARHLHVHALVAGGALTAEGAWVSPRRGFLFPVKALSRVFRGKFVAALTAARQAGGLVPAAAGEPAWRALLAQLYAHEWVVYAKAPLGGPAQVLDYLGRYTHRVAISNERIAAIEATDVALRVRADAHGGKRIVRLSGPEFIGRFLTHVLPPGFKRIRHYGLLGPAHKQARLACARAALNAPQPAPAVVESVAQFIKRIDRLALLSCPHCGRGYFIPVETIPPLSAQYQPRAPP